MRYSGTLSPDIVPMVWCAFFSTHWDCHDVKYPLQDLLSMDELALEEVWAEFFHMMYSRFYQENGMQPPGMYPAELLSRMMLPPDATYMDIRQQFRRLAMRYHPDRGGSAIKMRDLLDVYRQLLRTNSSNNDQ